MILQMPRDSIDHGSLQDEKKKVISRGQFGYKNCPRSGLYLFVLFTVLIVGLLHTRRSAPKVSKYTPTDEERDPVTDCLELGHQWPRNVKCSGN